MKLGVFGGTFNPPHVGHIQAAKAAIEQLGLTKLFVIPSGVPPHKALPSGSPSAAIRLKLTHKAFSDVPRAKVLFIESLQQQPAYTIDSIETIKLFNPDAELFLILGADMFLSIETWKDSERLLGLVTLAVLSRNANDTGKITDFMQDLQRRCGVQAVIIDNPVVEISSSRLRETLPERGGVQYLTDPCYSYIIKHRIYGAKPDWGWLRARAHSMLDPSRVPHVQGCEEEAPRLAKRWGVDPDDAREAAILHDITKRLPTSKHLKILELHDIMFGDLENSNEKLLHPITGALLAKTEFGVSDDVSEAIKWHTTARRDMTALEKVIYLADYIEPRRKFAGVDILRELAYNDLDEAMIYGLEMTIADIMSRSITPNEASLDALNDLRSQKGQTNDITG